MSDDSTHPLTLLPDETQRRGALVLRTLPILLIPVVASLITVVLLVITVGVPFQSIDPPQRDSPFVPLIPIVVTIIFLSALIILVRLGRPTISALLLIGVWTLFTTLGALRESVTSYQPALLIVPICLAGLLIDRAASVSLAALATLLVGSLALLEVAGHAVTPNPPPPFIATFIASNRPYLALGFWAGLFWTVAALTSLLAGGLQRALTQSRAQAQQLSLLSTQLEARVAAQTAELAQRAARAEALYEVSRALTRTLDLSQVLDLIAEQAARLLRFDSSLVLLVDPETAMPRLLSAYRAPADDDFMRYIEQQVAPQIFDPLTAPPATTTVHWPADTDNGSASPKSAALVLPMLYGERVAGVLVLIDLMQRAERSADDLALAEGFASQAAVAIVNAQLLAQSHETATLEERTRLAREIHDTLAQGLTGIVVQLGAAQRALAATSEDTDQHLDLAQRMAREALAEARRSVWNLRAPALERGDLADALRGLVARPLQPETAAHFTQRGTPWPLPPSVESALLRVAQEALVNVAKHARATDVHVLLEYTPADVRLRISDNGCGFDPTLVQQRSVAPSFAGGFGLLGMRERINGLGGTLTLANADGADVLAIVPRTEAAPHPLDASTNVRARTLQEQ